MKIKLLFLILIFFYNTGFSQTEPTPKKKNQFSYSLGYNFGALKNLEIAPVSRYDYEGFVHKFNYKRTTKREKIFEVQLNYLESELTSEVIPVLNLDYTKMGLGFSLLKPIYNKPNLTLYLGLHSQSNVSIYSKSNNHRSIIDQSFGITSQLSYQINNKQTVASKLIIPMVLLRTTHASSGTYSLNRYQSALWNVEYRYALSKHFDVNFNYNFNYDRLQISSAYRELQHQLNLGVNFKF